MRDKPLMDMEEFQARLFSGDRVILGRALNIIEGNLPAAADILAVIKKHPDAGRARVIGVTGPPGAGKSTLVNALVHHYRQTDQSVGVIAVDPSSPVSGGAILGDRVRMSGHAGDAGVFIRSVASRGHLGGLSRATAGMVEIMDAAGKDVIIVETVGTGQSEVEVMGVVQSVVVVCAPGLGDEIQAAKAGLYEIAHIFVVNKADNALVNHTERELMEITEPTGEGGWTVPVLRTVATKAEGVADLVDALAGHEAYLDADKK